MRCAIFSETGTIMEIWVKISDARAETGSAQMEKGEKVLNDISILYLPADD